MPVQEQQQQQQQQQQQRPKPDPNVVRLHDSRHYVKHTRIALAAAFSIFAVLIGAIELRERMSLDQFTDLVIKLRLPSVKSASWTVRHKDAEHQDLLGQIVLTDGTSETLAISFIDEFDDWKVLSFGPAAP